MTTPVRTGSARQEPPARTIRPIVAWGPLVLVVVLLVAVGTVASVQSRPVEEAKAGGTPGDGPADTTFSKTNPKSWQHNPLLPVIYDAARKAGTVDDFDWGDHCDSTTGRVAMPSAYAPPCTPLLDGTGPFTDAGGTVHADNGGATSPGVTATEIRIAYYIPSPQDLYSTAAALGVLDSGTVMAETAEKVVEAYNAMYNLYGRKVKLVRFQGSGNGTDPSAARSDAIEVATGQKVFASIGGPSQTSAYADELAKRGVLCIGCGGALPDSTFQKNAPYMWDFTPTPEQFVRSVFDFGIANLWGRPARFAGDPTMHDETRVIGIVHYDQSPPVFDGVEKETIAHYRKLGYEPKTTLTYLLDLDTINTQAQTIVAKLKADDVTTVVFLGDPLMLKALTDEATRQHYRPEWTITGTVFTDTTAAARLFDASQWAHAYGISTKGARVRPELTDSWMLYTWYFGTDPTATKSQAFIGPQFQILYTGLHMAGPDLTPYTFAGGMFSYPPTGGGVLNPRISFGFHGQFENADYVGVDDFTVVWWDADAEGPDEQDTPGTGMWTYVDGGKRYLLGKPPPEVGDGLLFEPKGSITLLDEIPAAEKPPAYDPWPGFPSARSAD